MKKYFVIAILVFLPVLFVASKASASSCTNLTKTLSKGSENKDVLSLQQFLFDSGYLLVKPNGYFGENTRKALIAFQVQQKITGVGFAGQLTRGKIKELSCTVTSSPSAIISKVNTNTSSQNKPASTTTVATVIKEVSTIAVADTPTIYVKTRIPTEITSTSATLSGYGGIDGEKHWFEWGKTSELGTITSQTVASTSYIYKITGLSPNTTYFFRAVTSVASSSERKGETAHGDILYFTTPQAPASKTPLPTVSISSKAVAVDSSGATKVEWTSTNTNTCFFTGGEDGGNWTKQVGLSGQYITRPITKSTLFGIVCKNNAGYTVTSSVTISKVTQ
jgi:peptidoglycan hydrolase-like protein with peptidoglycan-binding domain